MSNKISIEHIMNIRDEITRLTHRKKKLIEETSRLEFKIYDLHHLYEDLLLRDIE